MSDFYIDGETFYVDDLFLETRSNIGRMKTWMHGKSHHSLVDNISRHPSSEVEESSGKSGEVKSAGTFISERSGGK